MCFCASLVHRSYIELDSLAESDKIDSSRIAERRCSRELSRRSFVYGTGYSGLLLQPALLEVSDESFLFVGVKLSFSPYQLDW